MSRKTIRSARTSFPKPRRVLRHGFRPVVLHLEDRTLLSLNPTTTSIVASVGQADFGSPVTFTARVVELPYAGETPTGGTVAFYDNNLLLGAVPLSDGTANLTTTSLSAGQNGISATYSGDGQAFAGSSSGIITTVAGNGSHGYSGDGGPATSAELFLPFAVAVDSQGDLFIVDGFEDVVREVKPDGIITTVAGDGTVGYSGDGGPATDAELDVPSGVAVDAQGDLFIADSANNAIREVRPDGIITTVAGDGIAGYSGDGGPATDAELGVPSGVAADAQGDLFIADTGNNVIREVKPDGLITTVAGDGTWGYSGDGGPATAAELGGPQGVAVDARAISSSPTSTTWFAR